MDCKVFMYLGEWTVPIDAITMLATRSRYSHCGLWFRRSKDTLIIETTRAGSVQTSWDSYPWRARCDLYDVVGMDERKAIAAYAWATGPRGPLQSSRGYDWGQVLGIVALLLDIARLPRCFNPLDSATRFICTETVRRALAAADVPLPRCEGYETPQFFIDAGVLVPA